MFRKIRNSLSAKAFLFIALLLILCGVLIYAAVVIFLPRSYTVVASDRVSGELESLVEDLSETDFEDAAAVLEDFCRTNRAEATLSGWGESLRLSAVDAGALQGRNVLTTSVEVRLADRLLPYTLSVTALISAGHELTMAFAELLPLLLAMVIVIAALGALVCNRVFVRPVVEISRGAGKMASLDLDWQCPVRGGDELGALAGSLNTMARRLDEALSSLEGANRQLRADMEQTERMAKQRRDFFAAASHELKTPLTILRGQIESMQLGIGRYKDVQSVLPETLREVERMESLVSDLLSITRLGLNGPAARSETFDMTELTASVMEAVEPLAGERGMKIGGGLENDVYVRGDRALMGRAVHNIMSNAVRHSPEGAEVTVTLTNDALTVVNTGAHIPEEDLRELFTPFYRVEKSRARASGGSGLGLYITGTILDLHGMKYALENVPEGVRFTVEL